MDGSSSLSGVVGSTAAHIYTLFWVWMVMLGSREEVAFGVANLLAGRPLILICLGRERENLGKGKSPQVMRCILTSPQPRREPLAWNPNGTFSSG